jgi:hypothetical protein
MLQAGRSRPQFPLRSLEFSVHLIFQLSWGKGRPAHNADLIAICDRLWEPRRLTILYSLWPATGIALLFSSNIKFMENKIVGSVNWRRT